MNYSDRRRILILLALTVLALPAIWWLNIKTDSAAEAPSAATPEYEPEIPAFIQDDTNPATQITVTYQTGPPPEANRATTMASYRRLSANGCVTTLAPLGVMLTVTNLDNGQRLRCKTSTGRLTDDGVGVIINTDDFSKIGDLADSPVHVRITW